MLRNSAIAMAVCLMAGIANTGSRIAHAQTGYRKLAPFSAVRFVPEVQIDGQWYLLRSIDGVPVQEIVEYAMKLERPKWADRFGEDLVEVLTKMGHPPGETVTLVVRNPKTGKDKTLNKVAMTNAKRETVRKLNEEFEDRPIEPTPKALHSALDALKTALDERWSYRHANRADFDAAIAALRTKVGPGISVSDFRIELQKIIALGMDGHAAIREFRLPIEGSLPFLVESQGERFVAFESHRRGFLADGFPYLTRIDGVDVADWCESAAVFVPKGSPQYVRGNCLRYLRHVDYLRGVMKLPKKDTVEIELANEDGAIKKVLTLPVAEYPSVYGTWPRDGSRLLPGNIGYLRLGEMDEAAVVEIKTWMPKFRDTVGLIIDVRDNGGGSRDPLRMLYSYLTSPDDPPRVINVAAYRLHQAHQKDHLAARFMYRADAKEWTEEERRAIAEFTKAFEPEWELPKGQFSDWHYMVLSRLNDPDIYHYQQPVVVLMNAKCFSASDIFLAGLKAMKNVTLLGTPSGGGSAFSQTIPLGASPFVVRIASMASFQSDGKLFDGKGVQPDVLVEPLPEYHIGGRDNALEEAVRRIKGR